MSRIVTFLFVLYLSQFIQSQTTDISFKGFLQGAYTGTAQMSTAMNMNQHLPLLQPYNAGIWNYAGAEALDSIPQGMVDWVLLDLRTAPDTVIARKAVVLYSDGSVKDVNGNTLLTFPVPPGTYYIAVLHRNHLSAMTAQKLNLPAAGLIDFSDTAFSMYGNCQIRLPGGVMGLISGDINHDKVLKYSGAGNDRSPILQRILSVVGGTAINATTTGYYVEDLRMDGVVKYSGSQNDPSLIIQNIVALSGSSAINATFTGPVPHAVDACSPQPDQAIAGPDSLNIVDTTIALQANQPVNGTGLWTIISGDGGSLADSTLHNTLFTGQAGGTYKLVWNISNACGSTGDTVTISFADTSTFSCGGTLTDPRDGQQYPTVQIGAQCWMAKNLNIGTMVNSINTGSSHSDVSNNAIIEKYCYNNDVNYCNTYGGLYDWDEMMGYLNTEGVQGICPPGWHIPADAEWKVLEGTVDSQYGVGNTVWDNTGWRGSDAGGRLKEAGFTHWPSPNTGATNSSGFTALPGSYRIDNGDFNNVSFYGTFWSSSVSSSANAWYRYLLYDTQGVSRSDTYRTYGFSLRCSRDTYNCTPQPDQANAGPDSFNIPGDSIALQANVPSAGSGHWTIISGQGGAFADSTSPTTAFTGLAGQAYTLAWTISNACGYSMDEVLLSFAATSSFSSCGSTLIDTRDGQQYPTVLIGNQCWMAKNLNIGTFVTSVNTGSEHSDVANNGIIEKYCYDNDVSNCLTYGGLYDWNEMMGYVTTPGVQGICPAGWHLPTDAEWKILEGNVDTTFGPGSVEWDNAGYRGSDAGGNLKEADTFHWEFPNVGATNSSGFNALGGGWRLGQGFFNTRNYVANWWTSSLSDQMYTWYRMAYSNGSTILRAYFPRTVGNSVRCLLDSLPPCNPPPEQADAGSDSLNISGNSIQLQANQPNLGTGSWSFISGSGGSFSNRNLNNTIFYGQPGTTYVLAWTITNTCGNSSDGVTIGFSATPNITCIDTMTDARDGQKYPVVGIGNQCWMARNLNIGTMVNSVTGSWVSAQTDNGIIEKYCYNNDSANCTLYGGLYEWEEMMEYTLTPGTRGICPQGWHLPSESEWNVLVGQLGGQAVAGGKLKEAGYSYWQGANIDATNSSGFTALPGGSRYAYGSFDGIGYGASFWTSSASQYGPPLEMTLSDWDGAVGSSDNTPYNGNSVRCIQDSVQACTPQPDQANAGPDSFNIAGNSIVLQANIPVYGSGLWTVAIGQGGSFADTTLATTSFSGQAGMSYTLVWAISTQCGSTADTVVVSFQATPMGAPCPGLASFNYGGQTYNTVSIGTQCWMKENLNIGTMIHGSIDQANNSLMEKYCYNNIETNCTIYGGLYQWNEMMNYSTTPGAQGICPTGWHIPTDEDWCTLTLFLDPTVNCNIITGSGVNPGGKMKETGLNHWNSPNAGATNESGFTALGAGHRFTGGQFYALKDAGYFWTSSEYPSVSGLDRRLYNLTGIVYRYYNYKIGGFSVRCLRNN